MGGGGGGGGWDLQGNEERDGVRFSWNVWPSSKLEATRIVVPTGCLYSPLKRLEGMPPALAYDPIRCNGCGAILNPYAQIDYRSKLWACPFCMNRNHFPPHYAENISETNLPAELIPQFTTVEYELTAPSQGPPAFLFLVDTCMLEEELDQLKDSLQQTLNLLPEDTLVGLVTFGTNVMVHELGFSDCPKSYVFRGDKEYPAAKVQELLSIAPAGRGPASQYYAQQPGMQACAQQPGMQAPTVGPGGREPAIGRFLLPVADCSFTLDKVLDELQKDPWPVPTDQRVARCTGAALEVAIGLLESACPRHGSRIMTFVGGPPTIGPGMIVGREKTETIRSHPELQKGAAPHHKAAVKFYQGLADRAVANCNVVDFFACSLDQVGLLEIRTCIEKTGGLMVLADSFGQSVFKESLRRVFTRVPDDVPGDGGHLQMGFSATMEVLTSREFKVAGAIGPCSSLKKKGPSVAETEIGQGGTYAWSLGGITPSSTLAIYFEVTHNAQTPLPAHKRRFLQFVTQYQHPNGRMRLRSTTICGLWHSDAQSLQPIAASFDQAAAAVLTARVAVYRTETEDVADIMRWLDRSLIRLCAKFAEYRKDEPNSFRLSREFSMYPQFMFHLRRSQFLQQFNSSPDESSYYRSILARENTNNSMVMIQPSLLSYSFQGRPMPVLLDASSVRQDTILLLDTFFQVVVFHGETIAAWREQGYQEQEEHVNFRNLLLAPQSDAQMIMDNRFPVPRFIVCDQHKSETRFLMAKLNPSVTHNSNDGSGGQQIFTDDVSLRVFMEHLMNLSVQ
ncbi:vesicle coat complex COPII, subunit SEC23 [Tribonema minus]|uniref:Protein transport protein SEC23 n=1 Tax=Tribonema minus TaxID=303371 RepID=A0A835YT42_9STRA|nr:vesicle coat complex COPII, subunit SEC23 [Tribonema minus]